jgi:signal transduction histidine kinase
LVAGALEELSPQAFFPENGRPAKAVVPIIQAAKPIGVLVVESHTHLPESDLEFLNRLGPRAAIAIQNARLYAAVQRANTAKSKFVSVVSHELRIPMTSIKGYTDLLRKGMAGPVSEQQVNFLDTIRSNVDRMSSLVADLSNISRIETGRLKLEFEMLALDDYIQDTLDSLHPKMSEKDQTLELYIPEALPKVYTDSNRFMQVMTNLVSNAWKYTPDGGWITVVARPDGEWAKIEVRDTGIGISEEDQAQLFNQFFRSEDPAVREEQGWGLGLNVTKRLVELLGGEIGVSSTLGKGSTFWFSLPTQAPEASEEVQEPRV